MVAGFLDWIVASALRGRTVLAWAGAALVAASIAVSFVDEAAEPRAASAAQHPCASALHAVGHLERRGDRDERRGNVRPIGEQRREGPGRDPEALFNARRGFAPARDLAR